MVRGYRSSDCRSYNCLVFSPSYKSDRYREDDRSSRGFGIAILEHRTGIESSRGVYRARRSVVESDARRGD